MRWFLGLILITLIAAPVGIYLYLKREPMRLYSKWIQGQEWDRYYEISNYDEKFLKPSPPEDLPLYKEDYVQLWKTFPLRNVLIPLPTRHPLFNTVPMVEYKGKTTPPQLGMIFLSSYGRELSQIYTLPTALTQDHTHGQELFKLPYVRSRILKKHPDEVWKDVFTHKIDPKSKSTDEMIYDLYILHLRSKMLPEKMVRYGLIKNDQVFIELESDNKDYMIELIMNQVNGSIYSYVLKTERQNAESQKLRAKFLDTIQFSAMDPSMGRLLYTEFKQLNFARQVDQEGMLYLFSAWTQEMDNYELLREMIFYLERGRDTRKQLNVLYGFALKKYGKTFTTRNIFSENDDPELTLQRKIEIEKIENEAKAARSQASNEEIELSPDEKMNLYLKRAKQAPVEEPEDMTVH